MITPGVEDNLSVMVLTIRYVHTKHIKCCMADLLFLTQYLVQCCLHQTMEVSHTVMVSLELLYQLILWLPTVVAQATLLLVTVLEPVSLEAHGLVVHQYAKVSPLASTPGRIFAFTSDLAPGVLLAKNWPGVEAK